MITIISFISIILAVYLLDVFSFWKEFNLQLKLAFAVIAYTAYIYIPNMAIILDFFGIVGGIFLTTNLITTIKSIEVKSIVESNAVKTMSIKIVQDLNELLIKIYDEILISNCVKEDIIEAIENLKINAANLINKAEEIEAPKNVIIENTVINKPKDIALELFANI